MNFDFDVITPHMKRRQTGVTTSFKALTPVLAKHVALATYGTVRVDDITHLERADLRRLPRDRPRIWHARRNNELIAGLMVKWFWRKRLELIFTYATERTPSWITRALMRQCSALIAVSPAAAARAGMPCTVVPHGVDTTHFSPAEASEKHTLRKALDLPERGPLLGCFGRLREDKGTGDLIEALLRVLPQHPDAHVLLIGAALGKNEAYLNAKLDALEAASLRDRVHLRNEVPATQIADYYRALDLYVAPQKRASAPIRRRRSPSDIRCL